MPLVLAPELYGPWLDNDDDPSSVLERARTLALGLPLEVYASDPIGNNSRYEGPQALDAVTQPPLAAAPVQIEMFGTPSKPRRA